MSSNSATYATARLDRAARKAPLTAVNAATQLLQTVAQHQEGADFIADVLRALSQVAASVETSSRDDAGSGYNALIQFLEQPEVLDALRRQDPLLPAHVRGLRLRELLLADEGGACTTKEFAEAVGVTRQAIDKRRKVGTLIGLRLGRRGYVYPIWQIGLDGLGDVLAELQDYDPWTQLAFMLSPNSRLDGELPLEVLRAGEIARAIEAAQLYGEQVAT